MQSIAVGLLLAGIAFSAAAQATAADACDGKLPHQIRILDTRLAEAIRCGAHRSVTLQRLLARISELDGIVYVVTTAAVRVAANHTVYGALAHDVTLLGSTRVLRITVSRSYDGGSVAIVAHELRHAIEVLEDPRVRTAADVDALFERIGNPVYFGVRETSDAQEVERAVARELRKHRGRF